MKSLLLAGFLALATFAVTARASEVGDAAVSAIKAADNTADLEKGLAAIKDITPQQVLESKILWAFIKEKDQAYFATLVPDIDKAVPNWKPGEAFLFKQGTQVQAVEHYFAALKANDDNKPDVAKSEILEAIWLDPTQQQYSDLITKTLNAPPLPDIPMNVTIQTTDGKKVKLADYVQGNKALYIQIWATWCGPCRKLLPVLNARYKTLPPQGIAVIAMNSELGQGSNGGDSDKAKAILEAKNIKVPCLIEPADGTYTQLLAVDSVPRALLVDANGKVLFDGHPMDDGLVSALKKLKVSIDLTDGLVADSGDAQ